MTSLNDVLLAMSNVPVDDPIAEIWGRGLQGGGYTVREYTGTLPITITANGQPLLDYQISGNTEQTGTPTPENPIMPIGCGELETTGTRTGQYKLPILSNSIVTNIYLGEVQTTRRIKKLVLTGTEDWTTVKRPTYTYATSITPFVNSSAVSSHFIQKDFITLANKTFTLFNKNKIYIKYNDTTSVDDFKQFLAAQYAAGTPVTVWYVLAEPETGIVNEPLMKIGNYADTLSMEQADVSIPTNKGTTVIDYGGTTKPSKMYIKYLEVKK